jgi:hypothetical protein
MARIRRQRRLWRLAAILCRTAWRWIVGKWLPLQVADQWEAVMFFILGDRNSLIQQLPKNAIWAEVGVYRGDFSQQILDLCTPSELYLIDNWKFEIKEHSPFTDEAENFSGFSGKIHWEHFGDDPNATQEQSKIINM